MTKEYQGLERNVIDQAFGIQTGRCYLRMSLDWDGKDSHWGDEEVGKVSKRVLVTSLLGCVDPELLLKLLDCSNQMLLCI